MRVDNIDTISPLQYFNNNPFYFGNPEPPIGDRIDGFTWFEPGAIFPQPWTWNASESIWLSSPFILDWGYNSFALTSSGAISWTNRTCPFYSVSNNRIFLKHIFGNLYNVGSVAHDANLYYTFTLDRFLGSGLMASTVTISPDTQGMSAVSYTNQTSPEVIPSRPNSASLRRITMLNQNLWLPGNTWYQRLRVERSGSSGTSSGVNVAISLIQVLQFARLT